MTEMFEAALAALRQIMTPPFRAVLVKSLGTTLLLLALAWPVEAATAGREPRRRGLTLGGVSVCCQRAG